MGKASRKKRQSEAKDPAQERAPYVARPFEGLARETDWVAMREILPAATAPITVVVPGSCISPTAVWVTRRIDSTPPVAMASTTSNDISRRRRRTPG